MLKRTELLIQPSIAFFTASLSYYCNKGNSKLIENM